MLENLYAELIGIVIGAALTVLLIDTLYEYRNQKKTAAYIRFLSQEILGVLEDAKKIAFGYLFGGSKFLELKEFKTPIQAKNFATIMTKLYQHNDKIEQLLDTYSILATPELALGLREHLKRIDETLVNLCFLYTRQIAVSNLLTDDEVPELIRSYSGRESTIDPLDAISSSGAEEQSVSSIYRLLRNRYEAMIAELSAAKERKATFCGVLLHDSLLADFLKWLRLRDKEKNKKK